MYSVSNLKSMLFIDIETVSEFKYYSEFCENRPGAIIHWVKKAENYRRTEDDLKDLSDADLYIKNAALHPEFAKIIVISIGQIQFDEKGTPVEEKIKSFYGDDEAIFLQEFMGTAQAIFNKNANIQFTGHNIKNFDFPFLIKRSIINGVKIPQQLHLQNKKPWENCLLDTYEIWKFAGWNSASLDLICDSLNIPSPKAIMKGSETTDEYWNGNLEKIKEYCEADVKSTMNVMLKLSYLPIL
jgi:predicted PolB exonuclease-like 3'-5' exonuclease